MGKVLFLFSVLLGLFSCRTEVPNAFPEVEKHPVINCFLQADSICKVHISTTESFGLDSAIQSIENAHVIIQCSRFTDTLVYSEKSIYISKNIVQSFDTINVMTVIPGYDTVHATQVVPPKPHIIKTEFIQKAAFNDEGYLSAVNVTFSNEPNSESYYEVKLHLYEYKSEYNVGYINPKDSVLLAEGIPVDVFSNKLFSKDTEHTIQIQYQGEYYYPDSYIVELRQVTKDYYMYIQQEYLYEQGRYPEFSFSPVVTTNLYSNVENGKGIFAAFSNHRTDSIPINIVYEYY